MAVSDTESPLLEPTPAPKDDDEEPTELERSLRRLEFFLRWLGFCQHSTASFSLSWLLFLVVGVGAPAAIVEFYYCSSDCDKFQIKRFELEVLVCSSLASAISLLCVSRNLRKYGVRKFIFVDRSNGHSVQFHDQYVKKINVNRIKTEFFRLLVIWVLPCFLLKAAREILRTFFVPTASIWEAIITVAVLLVSWTYSSAIYLTGSVLFNLVCNLQVIHFENYGMLLERDLDISVYLEEHMRLTCYLSKISHRFRIFLILEFVVVTASEFVALLETTGNSGIINFINGADFAVSSILQVVGITICLQAAIKITHRAQGLASVASRWHVLVTSNSNDVSNSHLPELTNDVIQDSVDPVVQIDVGYSESDVESDYIAGPSSIQLASYVSTYHKREAFVMYMQLNPGGITIFGWRIDRMLMNTVFFVELSLVTFVLGKTISFSTK